VVTAWAARNLKKSLRVLRPGGTAIGIGGPPDPAFAREIGANAVLRLLIAGLSGGVRRQARKLGVNYEFLFMRASGDQLRRIAALVDSGVLRPVVGKVLPFDQLPQALGALEKGGIRGKAVVSTS
jgi:NADPH:quinone reductase-like Zn-dependent oxidoreductase